MPELPDISLYQTRLGECLVGSRLERLALFNPFTLRSTDPAPSDFAGLVVTNIERIGKRLVICFEDEHYAVIHLMIAGRFQWQVPLPPYKPSIGKIMLAALRFDSGQLGLVEASSKKRASIHLVRGRGGLADFSRGGVDLLNGTLAEFESALRRENRTLKRALTDPSKFDGIGNAYSDEILFHARLSPVRLTSALSGEEVGRLQNAARSTMEFWMEKLATEISGLPKPSQITAFRSDFATHGRFGLPCLACGAPIQRIVHAENETNYCAICQNEGRLLADRSLSRLLKSDWPKTLEELLGD